MIRYILNQIKIKSSKAFGQWIAKPVVEETVNLDATLKKAVYVNGKLTSGSSSEETPSDGNTPSGSDTPSGSGSGDSQTPVTPENPSGGDNGDDDGVIS